MARVITDEEAVRLLSNGGTVSRNGDGANGVQKALFADRQRKSPVVAGRIPRVPTETAWKRVCRFYLETERPEMARIIQLDMETWGSALSRAGMNAHRVERSR